MIICTTRSIGSASVSGSVRESMITGPDIKVQPISRQTKKSRTSATPSTVAVAPNPCSLLSARLRRCVGRHPHGAIFTGDMHSGNNHRFSCRACDCTAIQKGNGPALDRQRSCSISAWRR